MLVFDIQVFYAVLNDIYVYKIDWDKHHSKIDLEIEKKNKNELRFLNNFACNLIYKFNCTPFFSNSV